MFTNKIIKTILVSCLLLFLPIFKLDGFGNFYARVPQMWLWLSGVLLLYFLFQDNIWFCLFGSYCLSISIYHDYIVGQPYNGKIFRDFKINSLMILGFLCTAIWLINQIKDLDESWLKVALLYTNFIIFYFWIYKHFEMVWIAGAFLAWSIPLILTCTPYLSLAILATIPIFIGVIITTSSTAIIAAFIGVTGVFICKRQYRCLIGFILICCLVIGITFRDKTSKEIYQYTKVKIHSFLEFPFRKEMWVNSLKYKSYDSIKNEYTPRTRKDVLFGTGLRSYRSYRFVEGSDTLVTHPHNEFIEIYCELGLIGLFLFIGYLQSLFYIPAPIEYKIALIGIIIHCSAYYAGRLPYTGLLIIIILGIFEKYRLKKEVAA
jgi:hypothetical protein